MVKVLSAKCSACGYHAAHFAVDYNADCNLFTVPWAGLNGGIGEEISAEYWTESRTGRDVDDLLLSECCDAPSRTSLRKLLRATGR